MARKTGNATTGIEDVLNQASDLTNNQASYVTHIRTIVNNNEVTLDFFYAAPDPTSSTIKLIAKRLHRIILPLGLAKEFSKILTNSMNNWEETFGIELPIVPIANEDTDANISDSAK